MNGLSLKNILICAALTAVPFSAWTQDATDTQPASDPSMQDILKSLEDAPTPTADSTSEPAPPAATNENLQRITPDPAKPAIPTGTMVKPAVVDTQPAENVPAQPLENMNPALMPQAPADEAPKAVRAETPPTPPKPPAFEARPYVTLQTLDKVTARTATMLVKVGDTVAIGPLFVQVKTCQQAAPLETPDSAAFLEIWEAKPKDKSLITTSTDKGPSQWVFSGWMFASSPALSAMDHPIYDIWVLNCKKSATDDEEKSEAKKPAAKSDTEKAAPPIDDTPDAEAAPDTPAVVTPAETPNSASSNKTE